MTPSVRIKPGPHWLEVSALTTSYATTALSYKFCGLSSHKTDHLIKNGTIDQRIPGVRFNMYCPMLFREKKKEQTFMINF